MKISIITPTFNSQKTIEENINSVLIQTYDNWEHIVIDNLSSDKTLSIIKKFNNHKIKIISEKDKGIFDAIIGVLIEATSNNIIDIASANDGKINRSAFLIIFINFSLFLIKPPNFTFKFLAEFLHSSL